MFSFLWIYCSKDTPQCHGCRCRWVFGIRGCQLYGVESYTGGMACPAFIFTLCLERYLANRQRHICKDARVFWCQLNWSTIWLSVSSLNDFYCLDDTMTTGTWWLIALAVWLHAITWAILPILGWNRLSRLLFLV